MQRTPSPFLALTQNLIRGIGLPRFNYSQNFGSPKIQGFIMMDSIDDYSLDSNVPFWGTYNTLQAMGKLHGDRWLPYVHALIGGKKTYDLLGYVNGFEGEKYYIGGWNFFMDTDASVMGGNDIRENKNETFTTTASTQGYSRLDQYLMGLIPSRAVPPFFFVRTKTEFSDCNPFNVTGCTGRPPQVGVTFNGTKVNVTVKKIIRAEGRRFPSSETSQKEFREAFIFFVPAGPPLDRSRIAKIDKIRTMWQDFFATATGGHGRINTTLK